MMYPWIPIKCLEFNMLYSSYGSINFEDIHSQIYSPYLTSSINYLGCKVLSIVLDDTTKGVFNRRIITFHKMVLDETNGQRRFTYTDRRLVKWTHSHWARILVPMTLRGRHTNGPTANNGYLSLLRCSGHCVTLKVLRWLIPGLV